jgi:hypothetical protein
MTQGINDKQILCLKHIAHFEVGNNVPLDLWTALEPVSPNTSIVGVAMRQIQHAVECSYRAVNLQRTGCKTSDQN